MTTPISYLPGAGEGPVTTYTGTYPATVVNNNDPLGVGRLQLHIPMVLANAVSAWAVPLGTYYSIPSIGTVMSCVFLGGDPAQPGYHTGPLDLAPAVQAAAPPSVTYSAAEPPDPRVNDVWFELSGGVQLAPQVWTFHPATSTFSWVTQDGIGSAAVNAPSIIAGVINGATITGNTINGAVFNGTNWIENSNGSFYYSGTPAAGNLIASSTNGIGDDGLGNYVLPGDTNYVPNGGGGYVAVQSSAGSINFWYAANMVSVTNPWSDIGGIVAFNGTPNVLQLASGPNTGDYIGLAGPVKVTGGFHYSGPIVAYAPGGTTDETWHTLSLGNSWTGTLQYRLYSDNTVGIRSSGTLGVGTRTTGTVIATLPTAYQPAVQMDVPITITANTAGAASVNSPFFRIATNGQILVENISTQVATNVSVTARFPLD